MRWRTIKDWLQLPFALWDAHQMTNDDFAPIKVAIVLTQAIKKHNKNLPYWILIRYLRAKHKAWISNTTTK